MCGPPSTRQAWWPPGLNRSPGPSTTYYAPQANPRKWLSLTVCASSDHTQSHGQKQSSLEPRRSKLLAYKTVAELVEGRVIQNLLAVSLTNHQQIFSAFAIVLAEMGSVSPSTQRRARRRCCQRDARRPCRRPVRNRRGSCGRRFHPPSRPLRRGPVSARGWC